MKNNVENLKIIINSKSIIKDFIKGVYNCFKIFLSKVYKYKNDKIYKKDFIDSFNYKNINDFMNKFNYKNINFDDNYVSLFGSIGFIMCIYGMEVPNEMPLPSVGFAKPPTQNWSKEKMYLCSKLIT